MKKIMIATLSAVSALCSHNAMAGGLNGVGTLTQDEFRNLSQDLVSLSAARQLTSGAPLGVVGAEIALDVSASNIGHDSIWKKAGGGNNDVLTPRLTAYKGLLAGLDIGANVGKLGTSGISTIGGMVRYGVLESGVVAPSVTLRAYGSREFGSDRVTLRSFGADVVVAKPLALITPYAGLGMVQGKASASGTALSDVSLNRSRVFVGFDMRVALFTFSLEADKTGDVNSIATKVGLRF